MRTNLQASLDLTGYVEQHLPPAEHPDGSPEASRSRRMEFAATVVDTIRQRVFQRVRLTCSAGECRVKKKKNQPTGLNPPW